LILIAIICRITTVLVGANDDFGLSNYQGVSSILQDSSLAHRFNDDMCSDDLNQLRSGDGDKGSSNFSGELQNGFHNNIVDFKILGHVSNGGAVSLTPRPPTELDQEPLITAEELDGDDFWSDQIQKVKSATESTKALFQLSLADGECTISILFG
jgi:hypothetical protein